MQKNDATWHWIKSKKWHFVDLNNKKALYCVSSKWARRYKSADFFEPTLQNCNHLSDTEYIPV